MNILLIIIILTKNKGKEDKVQLVKLFFTLIYYVY